MRVRVQVRVWVWVRARVQARVRVRVRVRVLGSAGSAGSGSVLSAGSGAGSGSGATNQCARRRQVRGRKLTTGELYTAFALAIARAGSAGGRRWVPYVHPYAFRGTWNRIAHRHCLLLRPAQHPTSSPESVASNPSWRSWKATSRCKPERLPPCSAQQQGFLARQLPAISACWCAAGVIGAGPNE